MSNLYYTASAYKSNAVIDSLLAKIEGSQYLVIAKSNRLEFHELSMQGLVPKQEIILYGMIKYMAKIPHAVSDTLLLVTKPYTFLTLSFVHGQASIKESYDIKELRVPQTDYKPVFATSQTWRVSCLHVYKNFLQFLFVKSCGSLGLHFSARIKEKKVLSLCFLEDRLDIQIAVLYETSEGAMLEFYEVNQSMKSACIMAKTQFMHHPCSFLIPIAIHHLAVISNSCITVFTDTEPLEYGYVFNEIRTDERIDEHSWVLGNSKGELIYLRIDEEIRAESLGRVSTPSSITYLDSSFFFIGSMTGDSLIVKALDSRVDNTFLEEKQRFSNFAPILDLTVIDSSSRNLPQIATCSGFAHDGSVRLITKGIGVTTEEQLEVGNIVGLWSTQTDGFYSYLVLSKIHKSSLMHITNDKLEPVLETDFLESRTITLAQSANVIVQVTPQNINWMDLTWKRQAFLTIEEGTISHADFYQDSLVIVIDGHDLVLFQEVSEISRSHFSDEVACVTVYSNLIAIGFWENVSIAIYTHELEQVYIDVLSSDTVPRSLLFSMFENDIYLFAGLADGHLLYYECSSLSKTTAVIGTLPVQLVRLPFQKESYIFAACDSSVIIYSYYKQIFLCSLKIQPVSLMCPFQNPMFPECLALISGSQLIMASINEIKNFSSLSFPVDMTIKSIIETNEYFVGRGIDRLNNHRLMLFEKETFQMINNVRSNDSINCMDKIQDHIILGLETSRETGKIVILKARDSNFQEVKSVPFPNPITALCVNSETNVLGCFKNELVYWKIGNRYKLVEVARPLKLNYGHSIACIENYIAVADLIKAVFVYKTSPNSISMVCRTYSLMWLTSLIFINPETIAIGDIYGNLMILETTNSNLVAAKGIHIGENINCFRRAGFSQDRDSLLYGTDSGSIGVIIKLTQEEYNVLFCMQNALSKSLACTQTLNLEQFRRISQDIPTEGFIDGNFVEGFLNLTHEKQREILYEVNKTGNFNLSMQEIQKLVVDFYKMH